jgi:hypothetical protein
MADFGKPIQVTVNGEPRFDALVTPSLATAIESFERRRDWGLVYPAKITLDIDGSLKRQQELTREKQDR